MRTHLFRNRKGTRGGALTEFALLLPLLFLMCMGATDFGRLFFHAVTVANAAGVGAFHGAQDNIAAGEIGMMIERAEEDAKNLTGVTATAENFCDCPDNPAFVDASGVIQNTVDCAANCPGYGAARGFVRTSVSQTFQTIGPYPGIPSSTEVGRRAFMRVR